MKTLTALFFFLSFTVFGQSEKESCIKTRWIAVPNDDLNSNLFNEAGDSTDLLLFLKAKVESKEPHDLSNRKRPKLQGGMVCDRL